MPTATSSKRSQQQALTTRAGSLFLIDAMGYIFRAYHALPRLSNSRGLPTHATLGFANMLRKLLVEEKPDYIAAVFDVAGPTFREQSYTAYKANREEMPSDLGQQLPYIRRVAEAFHIPILEYPGFEADDVIGTIARHAAAAGNRVTIVSSDKDMLQLVNEQVCVLNPTRDNLLCDASKVEELLGVRPEQVVDLMALRGDSIDNIPGAPGIGEKGARDLIQRFGSVEAALEHAADVERKTYRESLQNHREQILLSKELARIHTDAPVEFDFEALRRREPNVEACLGLFRELEFTTLLKTFLEAQQGSLKLETAEADEATLGHMLAEAKGKAVALACAAGSEALGLAVEGGSVAERSAKESAAERSAKERALRVTENLFPTLAAALRSTEHHWVGHDWKELRRRLRVAGLPTPAHDWRRIDDTQLLSYLLEPVQPSHALDAIAQRRFGFLLSGNPAEDAVFIARLGVSMRSEAERNGLIDVYRQLDFPLIPVLERMEQSGVRVDCDELQRMSLTLEHQCIETQEHIYSLAGTTFNVNSPKQLSDVLFQKLGLPMPIRRGKGKVPSTAVDVLDELAESHEIVGHVLEFRQLSKLKSTYVDALPKLIDSATGRLHTTFSQVGTATGRLSSSNPNLQNIPIRTELGRQIRAAFAADRGYSLLVADYSQIELRLLAHFSQDALLLRAFQQGEDIHTLTASEVFGVPRGEINAEHRRRAKAVNFGIVYGLSAFGLSKQLGIPQAEAARFIQNYFERYSGVHAYIQHSLAEVRTRGSVSTLFGRIRPIPDITSKSGNVRGFAERTAINSPLQGTAADLMKLAMIRIDYNGILPQVTYHTNPRAVIE